MASAKIPSVVLAEADERIIQAAEVLANERIAAPVLIGDADEIHAIAASNEVSLEGIDVVEPVRHPQFQQFAAAAAYLRRPLDEAAAHAALAKPLNYGAMMVRLGHADAMIAGAAVPTALVIKAGLQIIGVLEGIVTASSFFLMRFSESSERPERKFIFADSAVNIAPNAQQLADIAITSADSAANVLEETPRVAMLSFSTKGSAQHDRVTLVTEALNLVKQSRPDLIIDGEFQFDAAYSARVAKLKLKEDNPVAGKANVFIFPDLNSGNIGYKITQYLGGAQAVGPILQGFAKPISDLSRGATVNDIIETTSLLLKISN